MEFKLTLFAFAALVFALVDANVCINGKEVLERDDVSISNCDALPCKLKRKNTIQVEMKFSPQKDITKLRNSVHANILGVPFPFIGVDGTSVCGKIFDAKTGAKVDCPLQKGTEYIFKDEFKVLDSYPKIRVTVEWELKDQDGDSAFCFQVPARITS